MMPDFILEDGLTGRVAGVDEVGRGPLAGPVVAAAVILDRRCLTPELAAALDDSKRVPVKRRETLYAALGACACIGVGQASVTEIDTLNILEAAMCAMTRAVQALALQPDHVLVDGNRLPALACPGTAVIGGDRRSLSIAAASIVAKVTRDRLMARLAERYPGYGWDHNAGYGTAAHLAAMTRLGITPEHRRSFRPVRNILLQDASAHRNVPGQTP